MLQRDAIPWFTRLWLDIWFYAQLFWTLAFEYQSSIMSAETKPRLGLVMLQMEEQLALSVSAGNNKAALFRLLTALSNSLDSSSLIYWGTDRYRRAVCVMFQYRTSSSATLDALESTVENMMSRVTASRSALYSASIHLHSMHPAQHHIGWAQIHYWTSLALSGMCVESSVAVDGPNVIVQTLQSDRTMSLAKFAVRPGALRSCALETSRPAQRIEKMSMTAQPQGTDDDELDDDWTIVEDS